MSSPGCSRGAQIETGELSPVQARDPARRLGHAASSEREIVAALPEAARALIAASSDLYGRVQRVDQEIDRPMPVASPAHGLLRRLESAF